MKFVDLFAGIGGFRQGFEQNGHECVFSSEKNENCRVVYKSNFGEDPHPDVTQIIPGEMPDFDILLSGFPCQPFSISGKKMGFEDTRGTLFFDICRILKEKNPSVVVLENVKHLIHHDKGNTLKVIESSLRDLGYFVSWSLLNAVNFGVPQNRDRLIIIATKERAFDFSSFEKKAPLSLDGFLDKKGPFEYIAKSEYTLIDSPVVQKSGLKFCGYKNMNLWKKDAKDLSLSRVHRQPNRIYCTSGAHPTLSSQETSGRFYVYEKSKNKVRKLTINECYRIMGFPENFKKSANVSDQYRQVGNSVAIPVIGAVAKSLFVQGFVSKP